MIQIKPYDIVLVDLEPAVGSEMDKVRPCVVVSPPEMHQFSNNAIIAPMTRTIRTFPTYVLMDYRGGTSAIALDHLRSISRKRIKARTGRAPENVIAEVKQILAEMFA